MVFNLLEIALENVTGSDQHFWLYCQIKAFENLVFKCSYSYCN